LSGLSRATRCARRIQWQIHDQSDGAAGQLACNARGSFARELPQLLLHTGALAVQRRAAPGLRGLNRKANARQAIMPVRGNVAPVAPFADESSFAADVLAGLSARPKRLPPKYFYDEAGSRLFEQITELPEYYPTRCELSILRDRAADIARFI